MNDMATSPKNDKSSAYQRFESKDSMEILLDKKPKSASERGTSESTSGCESGQNYESDEMECHGGNKSQSPSSSSAENISAATLSRDSGHNSGPPWHAAPFQDPPQQQ